MEFYNRMLLQQVEGEMMNPVPLLTHEIDHQARIARIQLVSDSSSVAQTDDELSSLEVGTP